PGCPGFRSESDYRRPPRLVHTALVGCRADGFRRTSGSGPALSPPPACLAGEPRTVVSAQHIPYPNRRATPTLPVVSLVAGFNSLQRFAARGDCSIFTRAGAVAAWVLRGDAHRLVRKITSVEIDVCMVFEVGPPRQ